MKSLFPLLTSMLPAASVAQSQLPSPQPNSFNLPFVLSIIGAFIASFVVAKLYAWPTLRSLPRYKAHDHRQITYFVEVVPDSCPRTSG
jgi:hypothetical protein